MQLEFYTTQKLYKDENKIYVHVTWKFSNPELDKRIEHGMDFLIGEGGFPTIEAAISSYEEVAHQELFNVINEIYPDLYTL